MTPEQHVKVLKQQADICRKQGRTALADDFEKLAKEAKQNVAKKYPSK